MKSACENCKWAAAVGVGLECRRRAPRSRSGFVSVRAGWWCGEYEPRPAEDPPKRAWWKRAKAG